MEKEKSRVLVIWFYMASACDINIRKNKVSALQPTLTYSENSSINIATLHAKTSAAALPKRLPWQQELMFRQLKKGWR